MWQINSEGRQAGGKAAARQEDVKQNDALDEELHSIACDRGGRLFRSLSFVQGLDWTNKISLFHPDENEDVEGVWGGVQLSTHPMVQSPVQKFPKIGIFNFFRKKNNPNPRKWSLEYPVWSCCCWQRRNLLPLPTCWKLPENILRKKDPNQTRRSPDKFQIHQWKIGNFGRI